MFGLSGEDIKWLSVSILSLLALGFLDKFDKWVDRLFQKSSNK